MDRVGDSGIWVIQGGWAECRLDIKLLPVVKAMLATLEKRHWSDPVNGLRAWADAVPAFDEEQTQGRSVVVFAVQNCSKQPLYYPSGVAFGGMVRATAVGEDGASRNYDDVGSTERDPQHKPYCRMLQPGEVVYLHPAYTCIRANRSLAPGSYRVTVRYRNDDESGVAGREDDAVKAWTGNLAAEPVTVVVAPEKAAGAK